MNDQVKRLTRLTTILTQLQTKKLITATELARKFAVSPRTIYRDLKTLEEAGVPIVTEEGKGYSLLDGYIIPPVMFTESEANALITAEKLILRNKDTSFVKEYSEAINKIKSVLRTATKDKVELLSKRVDFNYNTDNNQSSDYLAKIQLALTNFNCVNITYVTIDKGDKSIRIIEPFALYNTKENWILIAFCRLRNEFRTFRLDHIQNLQILNEHFESHNMTLHEYYKNCMVSK